MTRAPAAANDADASALARVAALKHTILRHAEAGEQQRRLPAELLAELHEARLFRLLLPRDYRGLEVSPPAFLTAMENIAQQDASTAWCLCQAGGCAMSAAYLDPAVSEEIWGADPLAVLAWGPGKGRAVVSGAGYRLSGQWAFASGGRHATWLGGVAVIEDADGRPRRHADGQPEVRTLLFPAAAARWTDIWDVIGLRATGSDAYAVDDLYVGRAYALNRDAAAERRIAARLYHYPAMSLFAQGFAATALGVARAMLDALLTLAQEKTPRLARQVLKDDGVLQSEVGECEARLGAAQAFLRQEAHAVWAEVQATDGLSIANRVRIRLAATHAIKQAKAVADIAYDAAGASAIFANAPFERRLRDIHTVAQQLQGRASHFRTVGAYLLGHPADLSVL
ncbi:MAG: acyl-CoA dehydrogenase [Alphaproteobacteria bacterium]|nr:acyl-CoA dehydrogenase [Alphaproteobacteria bacterium]